MRAFEIQDLFREQISSGRRYLEFLRVPDLSMGLYVLPANATDQQQPHTEDEVYYVLCGRGKFRAGDQDRDVQTGSIVFVPAHLRHQFHDITEELRLLVFFAPAEGVNSK